MTINTKEEVFRLFREGHTYSKIASILNLSRQRIQQIVRPPAAIYKSVKDNAKHRCEDCGIPLEDGHVHHNSSEGDFNDLKQLQYLCRSCHRGRHSNSGEKYGEVVEFRVSPQLYRRIAKAAKKSERSVTSFVRSLLESEMSKRSNNGNEKES